MAPPSVATTLIEDVRTRYAGTKDEAFFDEVAKNVAGVAYAGKLTVLSVPPLAHHDLSIAGADTVRTIRVHKKFPSDHSSL